MKSPLSISGLSKSFGEVRAVSGVSFELKPGEIFGFIGPNGAGKSTTIRLILGLIKPDAGDAQLFGKSILTNDPSLRQKVGYLPSEVFYYDNMRAIDLLRYSASFYDAPKKQVESKMKKLARLLDLDLDKKIDQLSYGNKKKVGIIQGLQHSPDLIILDEPTGGLDPLMQATFFELLREENKRGATILFSSHILSEVQRLCDRVAIIRQGKIVEVQSVEALRKNTYLRCQIESKGKISASKLKLPGISNLQVNQGSASFIYKGDVNKLTLLLSALELSSLLLEEPSLEDVFMHFYKKDS